MPPSALILSARSENSRDTIGNDLAGRDGSLGLQCVIGDVTEMQRVNAVMAEHQPEIVCHGVAHTHVPLMEGNPCEAVKHNMLGMHTVAEAAAKSGVERFMLLSTDTAVNASSVMGATKRAVELFTQDLTRCSATRFLAVRFGDGLGSNGSVVPRVLAHIEAGGSVTVTHSEMRGYFMRIPETVSLVLQAATLDQRGAVYVREMGEPIKVLEMARNLIRLSGFVLEEEISRACIGVRS